MMMSLWHNNHIIQELLGVNKNAKLNSELDKESIFMRGVDRKIPPSGALFVISRQALWCQMVILGSDLTLKLDS